MREIVIGLCVAAVVSTWINSCSIATDVREIRRQNQEQTIQAPPAAPFCLPDESNGIECY